jgi:hypothetical protein
VPTTNTPVSADCLPDPVAVVNRGLAVFLLPPGGRRPTTRDWQRNCINDPNVLRQLWAPGNNIDVGCRASNLVGIDLDRRDDADGIATFEALCAAHSQSWPHTLTVRTPHGGLHLYFRAPASHPIGSTSGGHSRFGPGIDTRGPGRHLGGYLIGPGSIVDAIPYTVMRDTAIQDLPAWLAYLLTMMSKPDRETEPCPGKGPSKGKPPDCRHPSR